MKISIATPVDLNNFGNRLQNYAVHKICNKIGLEAITIDFPKTYCGIKINSILRIIRPLYLIPDIRKISIINKMKKLLSGYQFTKKYISSFESNNPDKIQSMIDECDFFGIGGDQIWSEYWASKLWYCSYKGKDPAKKICFAPSFGSANLSEQEKNSIKKCLSEIEFPAVREFSGIEIYKDLTGKNARLIIDPVLMLTKDEWLEIADKNIIPKHKYVVLYILGADPIQKEKAQKVANQNGLEVIDVLNIYDEQYYGIGPDQFISLIHNAEIVFTDSYHTVLMSLIMETPFVICQRMAYGDDPDMNTRIDTIVRLFNLDKNLFGNIDFSDIRNIIVQNDKYSKRIWPMINNAWEYYKNFVKI